MSEKIFVVTLKSSDDLEGFYSDMKSNGFKLYQKRPMSKNTSYYMTDDQVKTISEDTRVLDVSKFPERSDYERISYDAHNMTPMTTVPGPYRKFGDGDGSDWDWAKLHQTGTDAQRRKKPAPPQNSSGFWDSASGAATPQVTDFNEFFGDGRHVDVIICDDCVPFDAGEFINTQGESWDTNGDVIPLGQSRVHQYDWFAELNQYVTSIDDDNYSIPGNNYTYYYDMASAPSANYHGLHVAGTACGNHYGWAKKANIYSIDIFSTYGTSNYMNGMIMFDYIRAFHRHKPINKLTGRRNPTVCNHSWSYIHSSLYSVVDNNIDPGDISGVWWDSNWYTSSNPGPSGWTSEGLWADFGIDPSLGSQNNKPSSQNTAIDDDIKEQIKDGVVHIGAAGNEHMWQVPERDPATGGTHASWGNYMLINGYGVVNLTRGGTPNSSAYDNSAGGRANIAINVGAIGNRVDNRPASFSNYGPKISTWAPGQNIISAFTDWGYADPKYGAPNFYREISGTSMASPQVCGIAACLASGKHRFTNSDLLGFLELYDKKGDISFDVDPAGNASYTMDTLAGTSASTTYSITATSSGASAYTLSGSDENGAVSGNNLTVTCNVDDTITFTVSASGHPFWIKTANTTGTGNAASGVTNNGAQNGTVSFTPTSEGTYYYICEYHGGMVGQIQVGSSADRWVVIGQDYVTLHNQADDPPISIQVGDILTFVHPGQNPTFYAANAVAGSHYEASYVDCTNMYSFSTANDVGNNPNLNIEVGDRLMMTVYIGTTGGTCYIKTTPSTGSGDLVTTGTFMPQNGWYISDGYWDTTGVTPGTYYYQDSADASCGGEIVVHASGTYYNHPLHIQNVNTVGSPVVGQGTVTNNGGATHRTPVEWNTQGVPEGTYYYVHGTSASAWGEIIVTNKPGVIGVAGNFADESAQKDSPNSEMRAVNPRGTGYLGGWNKSSLKGFRRWDEFNTGRDIQVFPRTNGLYTTKPGGLNHIYDVTAAAGKYVMTGSDRMDVYDAKINPTITIRKGDILTLNVNASGHPFWIGISQQTGQVTWNNNYGTITNNGASNSTLIWDTSIAIPGTYYYNCEYHSTMWGTIFVNA